MNNDIMSRQEFFDRCSDTLRKYGNPYGSVHKRGWGTINSNNSHERCIIARMIDEECKLDYTQVMTAFINLKCEDLDPLRSEFIGIFDFFPDICNNTDALETRLKRIADYYDLTYSNPLTVLPISLPAPLPTRAEQTVKYTTELEVL